MICPNCNQEMKDNDRCCLRCGTLNPNNPSNASILKYTQNKQVRNNKKLPKVNKPNFTNVAFIKNEQKLINMPLFILLNLIIYIIILYISKDYLEAVIGFSIVYFYIMCFELLFNKAGFHWWAMFIPIYNIYLLFKLAFGNGGLFIAYILINMSFFVIPLMFSNNQDLVINILLIIRNIYKVLNIIFPTLFLFCLGRRFGRSGIITVLFGFVVIPTIAISNKYVYD